MSKFKGTLEQFGLLKGKIGKTLSELKAELRDVTNQPEARLKLQESRHGKLYSTVSFAATVVKEYIFFNFISTKSFVRSNRKSTASAAKSETTEASESTYTATEAHAESVPTADLKVDEHTKSDSNMRPIAAPTAIAQRKRKLAFALSALLDACKRGALNHARKIDISAEAVMSAAKGIDTESKRAFDTKVTPIASDAPGICTESDRAMYSAPSVIIADVPTIDTNGEAGIDSKSVCFVGCGNSYAIEYQREKGGSASYARMAIWIEPEVVDGVLILRQAYSATQKGNVLEVI